jgi:spore maturation protein CgeB
LAVNPAKYRPVNVPPKYRSDICFVGSAFPVRLHFFDQMTPFLLKKRFIIIGQWWERLKNFDHLKHRIHNDPIPPSEVVKYYNGAKIVLNIHRTQNDRRDNHRNLPAYSPNNRTFEIAACRSFQLLSCRRDLPKFYAPGQEMVCFQNLKDLKRKINYYLAHEDEREQIAVKAYRRTLKDHTYRVRLRYLIHLLEKHITRRPKVASVDR